MLRTTLFVALAAAGLTIQTASAQDYDDRYYLRPFIGGVFTDSKRDSDNALMYGIGFGRRVSERVGFELDINQANADVNRLGGDWDLTGFGAALKFYPSNNSSGWQPYIKAGLGYLRHDLDFTLDRRRVAGIPAGVRGESNSGGNLEFKLGPGLEYAVTDRVTFGAEVLYRYDGDEDSLINQNDYSDWLALVGFNIALGDRASPPPPAPPQVTPPPPRVDPPPPPDDDRDGVLNAMDKCPNTPAGQMVNPNDGCPVQEVIDLRGVNFDFDKSNLRPDAVSILNNAVAVLKKHSIKVSVEGHTDSVGSDTYNQSLSERRSKVVLDYLLANGVARDRISGSKGWGESKPIDTNETAAGRANNRRTELVKQQ